VLRYLILLTLILFFFVIELVSAGPISEADFNQVFCDKRKGITGVTLRDRTRPDCVTKKQVIETDWAKKWYECLGQALHYSAVSGKKPACYLIVKSEKDLKYFKRMKKVIKKFNIKMRIYK